MCRQSGFTAAQQLSLAEALALIDSVIESELIDDAHPDPARRVRQLSALALVTVVRGRMAAVLAGNGDENPAPIRAGP